MKTVDYPKTMTAAVLWKTGKPLSIEEGIEIPRLERGQVLVKMSYSGVCRSQLMEVRGKRGKDKFLPHLLGHEGSGKVISVGPGVTKVSEGNWVILGWIKGKGKDVKGAKYNLGDQVINSGPVTTFSTYSIVSENRVVILPEYIPKDLAVLFGCALPTGSGILINEIKPRKNSKLAFVGLGGIGLSSLMASSIFECEEIIAIDVSEDKLKLAKKFGATHTINASRENVTKRVEKITNGNGVDYSIEAGGSIETIEMAFEILKINGGQCVFASHPEEGEKISLDPFDLISGKNIRGSWGGKSNPDKDIPKLANLYKRGLIPLEKLIKKRYKLEEINLALSDIEKKDAFRPLIVFDES